MGTSDLFEVTVDSLELFSNQKLSYCLIIVVSGGSHERRLLNDLSLNYNKLERPVAEESEALSIKFGLALQQILDVVKYFYHQITFVCRANQNIPGREEPDHNNKPLVELGR